MLFYSLILGMGALQSDSVEIRCPFIFATTDYATWYQQRLANQAVSAYVAWYIWGKIIEGNQENVACGFIYIVVCVT